MTDIQQCYQQALLFAAAKHAENDQKVPGTNLPYTVHISNVAMEILTNCQHSNDFNMHFAVQLALLHDTLEDTSTTFEELVSTFGVAVAEGVAALTKNEKLPKEERMADSLHRIRLQPKEVAAVKLADRITNLQKPPHFWDTDKRLRYHQEAQFILEQLQSAHPLLEERLQRKIVDYLAYIRTVE